MSEISPEWAARELLGWRWETVVIPGEISQRGRDQKVKLLCSPDKRHRIQEGDILDWDNLFAPLWRKAVDELDLPTSLISDNTAPVWADVAGYEAGADHPAKALALALADALRESKEESEG